MGEATLYPFRTLLPVKKSSLLLAGAKISFITGTQQVDLNGGVPISFRVDISFDDMGLVPAVVGAEEGNREEGPGIFHVERIFPDCD